MKKIIFTVAFLISSNVHSAIITIENDFLQWSSLAGTSINTIDFESIPASTPVEITGNEFSNLALNPVFSLVDGGGIFVGNPSTGQNLTPTSGNNMLFPECNPSCEGIIKVEFAQAITSFGAFFIDVEADYLTTGFSLNLGNAVPEISFSSLQGQNAQSFLGFISDTSFNSIDIHFTTGPNIDGTLIDDMVYSAAQAPTAVPIPGTAWLLVAGFAAIGFARREKQSIA